jgi:salicylate 5-hydroxylase small subunit
MSSHLTIEDLSLRLDLSSFYAEYAAALDDARYEDWLELFTDNCQYKLQPRENFDRGLPLATLAFESRGMLADRVYGIRNTLFHQPYYQRHIFGPIRILKSDAANNQVSVELNYAVYRTKRVLPTEVFNVGKMRDTLVRTDQGLRLQLKHVIFDSDLIANSIIYPL